MNTIGLYYVLHNEAEHIEMDPVTWSSIWQTKPVNCFDAKNYRMLWTLLLFESSSGSIPFTSNRWQNLSLDVAKLSTEGNYWIVPRITHLSFRPINCVIIDNWWTFRGHSSQMLWRSAEVGRWLTNRRQCVIYWSALLNWHQLKLDVIPVILQSFWNECFGKCSVCVLCILYMLY